MEWFDACCKGGSAPDHAAGTPTTRDLVNEMKRLHIGGALLRSAWADRIATDHANEQLFDDTAEHDHIFPVPEVVPEGGERFLDNPAGLIANLAARGAGAGVAMLGKNGFVLAKWCAGDMLLAMQDRRLPLMVDMGEMVPDHLHQLLVDYPELPVILQGLPRKGYHRVAYPLMQAHRQLHVVLAPPHSVHLGIDYLIERFGPEQFLWGSNFPRSEGGASIAGVAYAEMSDDARTAVAGGNLRRLVGGIHRG